MNDDTHEIEDDEDDVPGEVLDGSIAAQLKKIQDHLNFLEKKLDTLIDNSQRQPSSDRPSFRDSRPGGFRPREFGGGGFRSGGPRRDDRGSRGHGRPEGREPFRGAGRPEGRDFRGPRPEGRDSFRSGGSRPEGNRPDGNRGEARPFFKKGKRR